MSRHNLFSRAVPSRIGLSRDPFAVGFASSIGIHLCFVVLLVFGWGGGPPAPTGIVYSISLEGGAVLGGRDQAPAKNQEIPAVVKNVATSPNAAKQKNEVEEKEREQKVEKDNPKDAEVSLKDKQETKPTPVPKKPVVVPTPAKKADPKKDAKKEESKPTKKSDALVKDDVERDYQKALQKYLGESADAGGKGYGAAKLGPGKGMGGGTQMPPEFFEYRQTLRARLRSGWRWIDTQTSLVTRVSFAISRAGEISDIQVVQSSGNAEFDASVLRAITKANPLPPPPTNVADTFASVLMNFDPRDL